MEKHSGRPDKTNWQQTNRNHRYKYTGDNGNKWETPGEVETSTIQVKQIRV
jgi:hypothetical protein